MVFSLTRIGANKRAPTFELERNAETVAPGGHSKVLFDLIGHAANGVKINAVEPIRVDAVQRDGANKNRSDKSHAGTAPAWKRQLKSLKQVRCARQDKKNGEYSE
jgi:hypothetical protein